MLRSGSYGQCESGAAVKNAAARLVARGAHEGVLAMRNVNRQQRIARSVIAILAGAIVGIVLSLSTDIALHLSGFFPPLGEAAPDGALMAATAYRTAYGVLGSYLTARLAPGRPMQHALVLGALGMAVSLLGAVATWNRGPAFGPHWYPVSLIVLAIPSAWLGGWLRVRQSQAKASA